MRISIFGSGYVGLVQAAVFSEVGHQVTCMDIDPARIARIQGGDLPFFEPGLNELVQAGIAQNTLRFTNDTVEAVEAVIISLFASARRQQPTVAPIFST